MVEPQPSKLSVRVRFPLSAPVLMLVNASKYTQSESFLGEAQFEYKPVSL